MSHDPALLDNNGVNLLLGMGAFGFFWIGFTIRRYNARFSAQYLAKFSLAAGILPLALIIDHMIPVATMDGGYPTTFGLADVLARSVGFTVGIAVALFYWLGFVMAYSSEFETRERQLHVIGTLISFIIIGGGLTLLEVQAAGFIELDFYGETLAQSGLLWLILTGLAIPTYGGFQLYKITQRPSNFTRIAAALLIISAASVLFALTVNSGFGVVSVELVALAILGGVGSLLGAVKRYGVLDERPALPVVGRQTAIENIDSAILSIDFDGTIADSNRAAIDLFDAPESDFVGSRLEEFLPDSVELNDIMNPRETVFEIPDTYQIVSAQSAVITTGGRKLGYTVVFHDITEERRRRQRIQVLNRVLRHNLRNDLNLVKGYAQRISMDPSQKEKYIVRIQTTTEELIDVSEKAREIEMVIDAERQSQPGDLTNTIEKVVREFDSTYPDGSITVKTPESDAKVYEGILAPILRELIDNGLKHNDADEPFVSVDASVNGTGRYPITLTVADNGPGIPQHELAPIQSGAESALEHASGLGLWLVEWGVSSLNGQVYYEERDPHGTAVRLRLPTVG